MLHAVQTIEGAMKASSASTLNGILKDAGWAVLGGSGGASGAILGTLIDGMGDAQLGEETDCRGLAACLAAGLKAVQGQTKARPGDKTMMDALVPAVESFEAAASTGKTIAQAMNEAAKAARLGAEGTKDMVARYGRAKFAGEKTRGSQDPGATSIALIFQGFSTALAPGRDK
jgi:dihydroxyacetone kinase-like protein